QITTAMDTGKPDGKSPCCQVIICDTGKGIPPELKAKIFDPFFTTKKNGTGLGLSISAGIVEKHGGTITINDNAGGGTIFCITLPLQ
ncbi:MAG: HAMP domain-containing histidine kinase, partial [Chitinivibrionales bacterium]|nr:HAMP domain-containing histidine kinase [Chitinivibrionales bacterium]